MTERTYGAIEPLKNGQGWRITKSEAHVKRLILPVSELLGAMAEEAVGSELINGYVDVGPDLQMELLELEIHDVAKRAKIAAAIRGLKSSRADMRAQGRDVRFTPKSGRSAAHDRGPSGWGGA